MMSSGEDEPTRNDVATTVGGSSGGGGIPSSNPEWRFNETLRNVQGLVAVFTLDPHFVRSLNQFLILGANVNGVWNLAEVRSYGRTANNANLQKTNISLSTTSSAPSDAQAENRDMHRLILIEGRGFWLERDLSMLNVSLNIMTFLTQRSDDEINMLRQIYVDCPRTVPNVSFFQHAQIQKSLERMLYTWLDLTVDSLSEIITRLLNQEFSTLFSDCVNWFVGLMFCHNFWIQNFSILMVDLPFLALEPVSRHMEEQGLEFLQFAFRWFNCLLIREIPFHLVTLLLNTYLAEADSLPDFLCICICELATHSKFKFVSHYAGFS
ncbi:hypothetical protein ZIOFF_060424 [Zingiber officinale]|uniref:Rab-GAP TBC domain-containing protein n=1 Tax=Zingiber officinale TaxID=94328 RepID=A0A8J5KL72_ZINOF|nr:hypothetical protein ZIOFF_060424 [Zingiber officinale]